MESPPSSPLDAPAKAVTKLLEVAELLIAPVATRRQAKAEAFRIETITRAEIEAAELRERAQMSAEARMLRQQINKERILRLAAEEQKALPDSPDSKPLDKDWVIKFALFSQDVGDEEVQRLWAKLLAGEISQPGRFSVRLLSMLSMMTHEEARQFALFCKFVWHSADGDYAYQLHSAQTERFLFQRYHIEPAFYSVFKEIGLIEDSDTSAVVLSKFPPGPPLDVQYGSRRFRLSCDYDSIGVRVRLLTAAGRQLCGLCTAGIDEEYLNLIKEVSEHITFTEVDNYDVVYTVPPTNPVLLNG